MCISRYRDLCVCERVRRACGFSNIDLKYISTGKNDLQRSFNLNILAECGVVGKIDT